MEEEFRGRKTNVPCSSHTVLASLAPQGMQVEVIEEDSENIPIERGEQNLSLKSIEKLPIPLPSILPDNPKNALREPKLSWRFLFRHLEQKAFDRMLKQSRSQDSQHDTQTRQHL